MKPIDYEYWLSHDFWSLEQAAYLLNDINPDDTAYIGVIQKIHSQAKPQTLDKYGRFLDTLRLLENSLPGPTNEKLPPWKVFEIRAAKGLQMSIRLLKALNNWKKNSPTTPEKISDDEKMQITLQPIIQLIKEFARSDVFKKYDKETQQQQIEAWLKDEGIRDHQARHIRELITDYYGISSSRRK